MAAEPNALTIQKMIEGIQLLHMRTKTDAIFAGNLRNNWTYPNRGDPRVPFKGTNEEFIYLTKCLQERQKLGEDFELLQQDIDKERHMHLETMRQLELNCTVRTPEMALEERRLCAKIHDGHLESLKAELAQMKQEGFGPMAIKRLETQLEQSETSKRILQAEHSDILQMYQTQLDSAQMRVQNLMEELDGIKRKLGDDKVAHLATVSAGLDTFENRDSEIIVQYQSQLEQNQHRLQTLWEENQALGSQTDNFKHAADLAKKKLDDMELLKEDLYYDLKVQNEKIEKLEKDLNIKDQELTELRSQKEDLVNEHREALLLLGMKNLELDELQGKLVVLEQKVGDEDEMDVEQEGSSGGSYGWKVLDAEDEMEEGKEGQ